MGQKFVTLWWRVSTFKVSPLLACEYAPLHLVWTFFFHGGGIVSLANQIAHWLV